MAKMYARTTDQGTAAAETALCDDHVDDWSEDFPLDAGFNPETMPDRFPPMEDCTGNDALTCNVCGAG